MYISNTGLHFINCHRYGPVVQKNEWPAIVYILIELKVKMYMYDCSLFEVINIIR